MSPEERRRVDMAQLALRELELSVTTHADRLRVDRIRRGLRAMEDARAASLDRMSLLERRFERMEGRVAELELRQGIAPP